MMTTKQVKTIRFDGEAGELLKWAVDKAGATLQSAPLPRGVEDLVLGLDDAKHVNPIAQESYHLESSPTGQIKLTAPSQRVLAYAVMDLAEGRLEPGKTSGHVAGLGLRSSHMWLPFALGQSYGQQGYSSWESHTDWWWYDKKFWISYLQELASARFNMLVFWNIHPFPALIEFNEFPEANFFSEPRRKKNIEHFRWMLDTAGGYGIDIVIKTYQIHVSEGFGKKHGSGFDSECGYGLGDSPLVRQYNRYCIQQLFETYPQLSGLMVCLEQNKDSYDYVDKVIIDPLNEVPSKPNFHLRLWGQHFPEEIGKLADSIRGRFIMWHKICEESIGMPFVDQRMAKWRQSLPDIPICAIKGSGNASGHNHQGRIHIDPETEKKQLDELMRIGANGIGIFCGLDNWCYKDGGLAGQERAVLRWISANWAVRQVTGRLAWQGRDMAETDFEGLLAEHYHTDRTSAHKILQAGIAGSKVYPAINHVVSQYGQNLGFCGILGRFSIQTNKEKEGNYRLAGPYAWPFHDFGTKQLDIMQAARSADATGELLKLADDLESSCRDTLAELVDENDVPQALDFIRYAKLGGLFGPVLTSLFRAAVLAYRIPFSQDFSNAGELAQDVIDNLIKTREYLKQMVQWARQIPAVPINVRADLIMPLSLEENWLPHIEKALTTYTTFQKHLTEQSGLDEPARLYWQSHCSYHDVIRHVNCNMYHLDSQNCDAARDELHKAIALANGALKELQADSPYYLSVTAWLKFLETEIDRTQSRDLDVQVLQNGKAALNKQQIYLRPESFMAPCDFGETLLSFFEPESEKFALRCLDKKRYFTLAHNHEELLLNLQAEPDDWPEKVFVQFSNRADSVKQLEITLATGKTEELVATLYSPHSMRLSEPRYHTLSVQHLTAKQDLSKATIKIPFNIISDRYDVIKSCNFNLVWQDFECIWSPVWNMGNWWDPNQMGQICFYSKLRAKPGEVIAKNQKY